VKNRGKQVYLYHLIEYIQFSKKNLKIIGIDKARRPLLVVYYLKGYTPLET
jgi:hypothetical protein